MPQLVFRDCGGARNVHDDADRRGLAEGHHHALADVTGAGLIGAVIEQRVDGNRQSDANNRHDEHPAAPVIRRWSLSAIPSVVINIALWITLLIGGPLRSG